MGETSNGWPEMLTTVFTGIIAFTGIWGAFYAYQQIKDFREESRIQHLLSLQQQYQQQPMVTYRQLYAKKRLAGMDDPPEEFEVLNFFETVALLDNHGYLTDSDVWETFGTEIFPLYADAREAIEQDRKDDKAEYSNLLVLIPRLEAIDEAEHGTESKPSREEIKEFWEVSADTGVGTPIGHQKPTRRLVKR